ncbi:MAG: hypothetical protein ACREXR_00405 [Gammaproteobacteria bacterium]
MAKSDSRRTVIEIVNEVRRLMGYSVVTELDADKHSLVLLRLLNTVMSVISDYADWEQQRVTTSVTAISSTATYSLGITQPSKRIEEISFDDDARSLHYINVERYNRYTRGSSSFGRPRFFTIKGLDSQGNPQFLVHPIPVSAQAGLLFSIEHFTAPRLLDISSADEELPFDANVIIQGLYKQAIAEENSNTATRDVLATDVEFIGMMAECQRRFTTDTGTDTYFVPPNRG